MGHGRIPELSGTHWITELAGTYCLDSRVTGNLLLGFPSCRDSRAAGKSLSGHPGHLRVVLELSCGTCGRLSGAIWGLPGTPETFQKSANTFHRPSKAKAFSHFSPKPRSLSHPWSHLGALLGAFPESARVSRAFQILRKLNQKM